jgi:hypothetical protein
MRKLSAGLTLSYLLSIGIVTPVCAGQQTPQTGGLAANSGLPAQPPQTSDEKAAVAFKNGRLSANIQDRSLERVADEFSRKTGVRVILDSELLRESVSIQFQSLSVEEGLRQLFRKHDAFFFYGVGKDESSALKVVWVYPKGRGRSVEPIPSEKWASTEELYRMLSDPDPKVRGRAFQGILERKGDLALDAVQGALQDPDEQVRSSVLEAAIAAGIAPPPEFLRNVVLKDTSVYVRCLAVQALADSPDAQSVAESAMNDPSEAVRTQAQEILRLLPGNQSQQQGRQQPAPNQ